MDTNASHGGANTGPSPMEIVACALGGCTAMDVVAILNKKRKLLESLIVRVTGKRSNTAPSVFEEIELDYRLRGPELTDHDVQQAIELSIDKYCSVVSMLRPVVRIVPKWTIERSE